MDDLETLKSQFEHLESVVRRHLGPAFGQAQPNTPHPSQVPAGLIAIWSGAIADIPIGWALCDGNNGTPDLTDKFVIGAGSTYDPDDTGGAASVTLTGTELPAHTHTGPSHTHTGPSHSHTAGSLATSTTGSHTHTYSTTTGSFNFDVGTFGSGATEDKGSNNDNTGSNGNHSHTMSGSTGTDGTGATGSGGTGNTGSTGTGSAFSILPPYYALAFIMKI